MSWTTKMYAATAFGAVCAMFYPALLRLFTRNTPVAFQNTSAPTRWILYLVSGTVIGMIVAALAFVGFLGDKDNQAALMAAGVVAYFGAFTAGFAAGSVAEEPLKKA